VEDFRTVLFSSLLRPLRLKIGDEANGQGKAPAAYTDVAVKILDTELRCSALHRVLEFQRLLSKKKQYQDVVEQARSANCSASVTESFVQKILTELPAYTSMWSSKIWGERTGELSRRVLADVVQGTMREPLSTLDDAAMELLREDDSKRKKEALEK